MTIRHIYNTLGESPAFIADGHLFTARGEWLGTLVGREAYNVDGEYIGWIDDADRLVRPRSIVLGRDVGRPRRPMTPVRPIPPKRRLFAPPVGPRLQDVFETAHRPLTALVTYAAIKAFERFQGCRLLARDGAFLGLISRDRKDPDSIADPVGPYGDSGSPRSIFNPDGEYGSGDSPLSAFNSTAPRPPRLHHAEAPVATLTLNVDFPDRIDPNVLISWLD
jgi:hypothetical protein